MCIVVAFRSETQLLFSFVCTYEDHDTMLGPQISILAPHNNIFSVLRAELRRIAFCREKVPTNPLNTPQLVAAPKYIPSVAHSANSEFELTDFVHHAGKLRGRGSFGIC